MWEGAALLADLCLCFIFTETGNYTCEFCGKQYKYYTPYQEHVALHAPISEYPYSLNCSGWWEAGGLQERVWSLWILPLGLWDGSWQGVGGVLASVKLNLLSEGQ